MALAETRAAWQRTASRCIVQEDAKRAPKLARHSSLPPFVKTDTGPNPCIGSLPFDRNHSSNLLPNSKLCLQLQPNHAYQKYLFDEQFNSREDNMETFQDNDKRDFRVNEKEQLKSCCSCTSQYPGKYEVNKDVRGLQFVGCEASKNAQELYFDSESSWIGAKRDIPWWRTADSEELALLVAHKSLDHIENCDLPRPQTAHVKKDLDANIPCFCQDGILSSSPVSKPSTKNHRDFTTRIDTLDSSTQKHKISAEGPLASTVDKPLWDSPTCEKIPEMHELKNEASKAQLLEALGHSQTRAREAEEAAKQACAEKENVVKLVFRQAYQIFAYKQWLQILQLENNRSEFVSIVFPTMSPPRTRKMHKSRQTRNRAKRSCPKCGISKCAVVLAFGLGLVGAGLILGWTMA